MTSQISTALLLVFTTAIVTLSSPTAGANFASDPTRKESAAFTHFFLKRFDKWFTSNVGDPRKGLDKKEIAFVDEFLLTAPAFGMKTNSGFIRGIQIGITVHGEKVSLGPYRFVLSDSQQTMKPRITEIARAKGVSLDKAATDLLAGVGFTEGKDSIELIFKDSEGTMLTEAAKKSVVGRPVWVTRTYRGGKVVGNEFLEPDVETESGCVGSRTHTQSDRITVDDGTSHFSCHTSQFEDRALAPAARALAVKIRRGINLVPGALEVSGRRVRMFYP